MTAQLHSVIPKLPAGDLQATKSFYVDKLKFRRVGGDYPDYLMLSCDEIELHFFLDCDLDGIETMECGTSVSPESKNYMICTLENWNPGPWGKKNFPLKTLMRTC